MINLLRNCPLGLLFFKKKQMKLINNTEIITVGTTMRMRVRDVLLFFPEKVNLTPHSLTAEF